MAESPEESALRTEFARRVKRRRMALGLMQTQLADTSGINQAHISRIERGLYRTMNLMMLVRLAKGLHTSLDYLLGFTDDAGDIPFENSCVEVA